MQLVILFAWLSVAAPCDVVVRYSNLQVDASAMSEGDGSECFPFKSLANAIAAGQSQAAAIILLLPSPKCVSLEEPVVVFSELTVEGRGNCLQIKQPLLIGNLGNFVVKEVNLSEATHAVQVMGKFHLMKVVGESSWSFNLKGGTIHFEESRFINLASVFIRVQNPDSPALCEITIVNSEISGSGIFLEFIASFPSSVIVSIINSAISAEELATGTIKNTEMTAYNSTLTDFNHLVRAPVLDSHLSFENCTITNIANPPIALESLRGSVTISKSTIHSIAHGPIVLLSTNSYPSDEALIRIDNCSIWNVTNPEDMLSAAVLCVTSATSLLTNTEVKNTTVWRSGLLRMTAGVAQLANVYYHDSSNGVLSIFELFVGFISVENMTVLRVENNDENSMTMLMFTVAKIVNMSVVDSIDKHRLRHDNFIILGVVAGSSVFVYKSYFKNPGDALFSMAAISATLTLKDSIFDNNQLVGGFLVGEGGRITMINITFRDWSSRYLYYCSMTDLCMNISNINFEGQSQLKYIFQLFSGTAILTDSHFQNISFGVATMNGGRLEVRNTSFLHSELSFCENCLSATLYLQGISATHTTTNTLFDLTFSQVQIVDFALDEVEADCLFQLESTNITLRGLRVRDFHGDALGGILRAVGSSIIVLESSSLETIRVTVSIANGLIYVQQCTLMIANLFASNFSSTLINSVESHITIVSSQFEEGGLLDLHLSLQGGVLKDEAALSVLIANSVFSNIAANAGGALYFSNPTASSRIYDLKNLTIRNCFATGSGGGIYGFQVSLSISSSVFEENSATRGAGVWVTGSSLHFSHLRFSYNSAVLDGGGFQYVNTSLWGKNLSFNNNSAVYGPDIASQTQRIFVVSAENKPLPNYHTVAASGQWMIHSISLGLFDVDNQLIATDNSSQLILKPSNDKDKLEGSVLLYPEGGVYRANRLMLIGNLLSSVNVKASLPTLSDNVFTVSLRDCEIGEARHDSRCIPCTNNMYSLDPSIPCALCIPHATCTDGYKLSLSRGYWRSATTTDKIYKCLAEHLCMGGFEMECADGHRGVMCNECADGFYKGSQLQCFRCKNPGVAIMKATLSLSIGIASVLYTSHHGYEASVILFVVLDFFSLMRVFANLNVYWPDAIGYLLVVLGDIGSMGMTAFADSCLGSVVSVAPVYSQVVISVVYFFSLLTGLGLLSISVRKFGRRFSILSVASVVMTAGVCMLPLLFMRAVQLFSCYEIDGVYRLVIDPSEKCWTKQHKKFALGLGLPIITCCLVLGTSLFALSIKYFKLHCIFQPMQSLLVSAILLRSFAASSYFVLSNALVLSTQAGVSLLLNLAADILLLDSEQRSLTASTVYDLTLFSSTVFVFICLLYESVDGEHSESESAGYSAALYLALLLPLLLYGAAAACKELKKRKVQPMTVAGGIVVESDGSFLQVPNQSMTSIMQKDEKNAASD